MSDTNNKSTRLMSDMPELASGNSLFRGAAIALGLQGHSARLLLNDVLRGAGQSPETVTPEEMGVLLPEIEILVRKLLPPDLVQDRMQKLQRFLINVDDRG